MTKKKNKTGRLGDIVLIIIFLIGLSVLLYPSVSNYLTVKEQSAAIEVYDTSVSTVSPEEQEKLLADADAFNVKLRGTSHRIKLAGDLLVEYENLLNPSGSGMMGYVEIPKLMVDIPIYHGVEESTLQIAAGHLNGSSLPVGGESTHSVLMGHRGLPSARLFTDIDQLEEGDMFALHVFSRDMAYEVDQILIVKPDEMDALDIVAGMDFCTLLTCTPYGVNTHRLLVRGRRVPYSNMFTNMASDAVEIDNLIVVTFLSAVLLFAILIAVLIRNAMRKRRSRRRLAYI